MKRLLLAAVAMAAFSTPALAVPTVGFDDGSPVPIDSVDQFGVTGPEMAGLSVTVTFGDGRTETVSWTDAGGGLGEARSSSTVDVAIPIPDAFSGDTGVVARSNQPLWILTQGGDTYTDGNLWAFNFHGNTDEDGVIGDGVFGASDDTSSPTAVTSIRLNGEAAGVAFDVPADILDSVDEDIGDALAGTPGSEHGKTYTDVSLVNAPLVVGVDRVYDVTYSRPAAEDCGTDPVFCDLYFDVLIEFDPAIAAPRTTFFPEAGSDVIFLSCAGTTTIECVVVLPSLFAFEADTDLVTVSEEEEPTDPTTPVPEPATLSLLGLGLVGLGLARRRRRRIA